MCKLCSECYFDCFKLVDGFYFINSDVICDSYVICFWGRIIVIEKCWEGVFDFVERCCMWLRLGGVLGCVIDIGL